MVEPKKPQKPSHNGSRNASDRMTNPAEPKAKSRDKYKLDIPLQTNQISARTTHSTNNARTKGDWFKPTETAMKGFGIMHLPEEKTPNDESQELEAALTPEIEDTYFNEGEPQMSQEETDDAYSEYLKDQKRQEEEMDEAIAGRLKSEMWKSTNVLKSMKDTQSWKKMGFFKDWLKSILEIADEKSTKPTEPTIAFLTETNAYLTRKLQELEKNPIHVAQPQTHDPVTQAMLMAANTHPTWATVAAAPAKANQPTTQKPTKPLQTHTMPQEPMADPCCLIIQVQPPNVAEERPNGIEVRKKINEMLDKKGVLQFFHIMAVGYSGVGNIKITMTHTSKASDLMKYGKGIANIIMKNEVLLVLPDTEHYCIKINKVLTWCGNNEPMSIDMIHEELCTYLPGYKSMKQWHIPHWLGNEENICTKEFTLIMIDLTNKQDKDNLLEIA